VAVTRLENKTFATPAEFKSLFQENIFLSAKQTCEEVLLRVPDDAEFPEALQSLPRQPSGEIDNFNLAKIGRKHGFNTIVTGGLLNITTLEEERGFLWYKDTYYFANIQVKFEGYDTSTGAKLFNENFIREVEMDEIEYESIKAKSLNNADAVIEALKEISSSMGEKLCDVAIHQPWKGYIVSANGKNVVLSSGRQVGINPGDELAVFDSSTIIDGANGQRFFLPGLKTGAIQITEVGPGSAEAKVISGKPPVVGSTVMTD
jgi:hypothetical protein